MKRRSFLALLFSAPAALIRKHLPAATGGMLPPTKFLVGESASELMLPYVKPSICAIKFSPVAGGWVGKANKIYKFLDGKWWVEDGPDRTEPTV